MEAKVSLGDSQMLKCMFEGLEDAFICIIW